MKFKYCIQSNLKMSNFLLLVIQSNNLSEIEWVIVAYCQFSNFSATCISWREQVNCQWEHVQVHFVLDQHAELDFIVLAHWNNSLQVDISLNWTHYSDSEPTCLVEKQQIHFVPILYSLIWPEQGSNPQSSTLKVYLIST